jgi:hypothetical protein
MNVGDVVCFPRWVKINRVGNNEVNVTSLDTGVTYDVRGENLISDRKSADEFDEEVSDNKTNVALRLSQSFGRPFTVCFTKADGTDRTMRGRLIEANNILGRSTVEDLDIDEDYRLRQVDHRTINSLIVDGKKYVVK